MKNSGQHTINDSQTNLLGFLGYVLCLWFVLLLFSPSCVAAEDKIIPLKDGTVLQITKDAIFRLQSAESDSVLWSVASDRPQLPLLFTNSAGTSLLFYFNSIKEHYGEYHALRIADGKEEWMQPVWSYKHESPVSPIFLNNAIYLGHGLWLERIDPDDGCVMNRYAARTPIKMLRILPDGKIEIQAEKSLAGDWTLTFQDGRFSHQVFSPDNLLLSFALWKRAGLVFKDFDSGYLDLYRLPQRNEEPLAPQTVLKWRDVDLNEAEKAYRRAYHADPTNPAFALYLALTLHYQQRDAEAEAYKNEALRKSAPFWEESLRLGGFGCEALQLIRWADEFYAQGMARYIQDIPAPMEWMTLIEVLIHFGGTRSAARGPFERALHVLELRRRIMPYTEGDNYFSHEYARILLQQGQHAQAEAEARRIGKVRFFNDFLTPTPFSFIGFLIAGVLVGGVLILHNEIRHRVEWWPALSAIGLLGFIAGHAMIPDHWKVVFLPLFLLGYVWIMAYLRRRRETPAFSQWRMMAGFALSSYIVLLTGVHVAYLSGQLVCHSPLDGKVGEVLLIGAGLGLRRWLRSQRAFPIVRVRRFALFCSLWALIWLHLAWMDYYSGIAVVEGALLLPSMDLGHPNWRVYIEWNERDALFWPRDFRLLQGLVHQLNNERDVAQQVYREMRGDARALNNLGVMSLEQEQQQARTYFEQALKRHADYAPALYNLGVLTKNQALIEQAKNVAPWPLNVYQTYAPDKAWIVMPTPHEWTHGVYWSRGGFPVRGFTEIAISIRDALFPSS